MQFNPIGVHFIPTHQGQHHYQFIRDMQPGILKLVASSTPDVQQIADGYAAAPNALLYLRNVARSEQHDFLWRDPIGAATQHVKEWHADIQERTQQARDRGLAFPPIDQIRILGVNEPIIELFPRQEDMSNYAEWLAMQTQRSALLDSYMETFGLEANKFGYGAGLGNISSGQPANPKPGEYATFDWFPRTRKLLESTRGKNAYVCQEYWRAETGPEGHADWHAWRFTHLNVDCDIDVLESGVDQRVTSEPDNGNRGWVGHMDAAAYVDQHRRYIKRARQDSRFRCETPFTLDGDKIWESFWIEYCRLEMVALSSELRATVTTHLPIVSPGPQPVPPPQPSSGPRATPITPAGARIRSGPGVTFSVLGAVPKGTPMRVTGKNLKATWYRVDSPFGVGWVSADVVMVKNVENVPVVQPSEPPVQPPPQGDTWARALAFVLKQEGGWADDPNDPGGATMRGVTIGTYTRWREAHGQPVPTKDDLRNISDAEVEQIYREWYWLASGSDKLSWPLCLANMDTAVNAGVGRADEMLRRSNGNFLAYMGHLIDWYTRIENFEHFGRGWIRRRASILLEASNE